MNLAIIGGGNISQYYFDAINSNKAQLSKIFDRNPYCTIIRDHPSLRHKYTDNYFDILNNPNIDGVIICLPNGLHHHYADMAVKSGKNVCLEKPATTRLSEYRELIQTSRSQGVFTFVSYHRSHNHCLEFFQPKNVSRIDVDFSDGATFNKKDWYFNKSMSGGGCIIDSASNIFNFLLKGFKTLSLENVRVLNWLPSGVESSVVIDLIGSKRVPVRLEIDWMSNYKKAMSITNTDGLMTAIDFVGGEHETPKHSMRSEYRSVVHDFINCGSEGFERNVMETCDVIALVDECYQFLERQND